MRSLPMLFFFFLGMFQKLSNTNCSLQLPCFLSVPQDTGLESDDMYPRSQKVDCISF